MMEEVRRSMMFVSSKENKACTNEWEEDSAGSSEEMESPRSVGRWRRRTTNEGCVLHRQVLRIREEDSHLGESTVSILLEAMRRQIADARPSIAEPMEVRQPAALWDLRRRAPFYGCEFFWVSAVEREGREGE